MKKVLDALPANVFGEGRAVPIEREERIADAGMREGAFVEKDGGLFTVSDGALVKPEWADKPKKVRQAASYVGVKKSVFDLINAMNSDADDAGIGKLRDALNSAYDAYVKDYAPINKDGNGFLEDDIEFPTVAAIERLVSVPVTKTYKSGKRKGESYQVDEKRVAKADIFTKRTIFPFKEPTSAENIQDAIKICRIFRTGIDVGYIGNLLGMSPDAARAELLKTETLFENPETGLIEPGRYLPFRQCPQEAGNGGSRPRGQSGLREKRGGAAEGPAGTYRHRRHPRPHRLVVGSRQGLRGVCEASRLFQRIR